MELFLIAIHINEFMDILTLSLQNLYFEVWLESVELDSWDTSSKILATNSRRRYLDGQ